MKPTLAVSLAALALSIVCSAPAEAQFISGIAYTTSANRGTCCYAQNFKLKWCKADANGIPTTQCTTGMTNNFGQFGFDIGHGSGRYFPYLWDDAHYWGSEFYPANGPITILAGPGGNQAVGTLTSTPRALPPQAVYPPDGAVNVPTSFILQWTDGLDVERRRTDWPVTYDIWSSGNEFPEQLVFSNVPCGTSPTTGTCSIPVAGLVYTSRYQWRVVARMHSGPVVVQAGADNSYLTTSATFRFSTTWDPATPYYTIRASSGNLVRATNGGGGTVNATGTSSTYETQFKFLDPNGGSLFSGDPIHIQTNRNYFLSAVGGGGSGIETQKWTMGYETWTIHRVAGFGAISAGDQVAFRSANGYYMSALNGGGSSLTATATSIGTWETFTFQ